MATITDKLYELESSLELLISKNKTGLPVKNNLGDIVSHLDYIIELMGLMVGEDTYESIKEEQRKGYNGIYDRVDTINKLLQSGEISGDVDLFPLTITENGNYSAGLGKGFTKVTAEIDAKNEREIKLIGGLLSSYRNPHVSIVGNLVFANKYQLTEIDLPACTSIESSAFFNCFSLSSVSFPACTSIGGNAFKNCTSLNVVSFPACSSIGSEAFSNCSSLSEFYLNSTSFTSLATNVANVFTNYSSISFYVPASLIEIYQTDSYWSAASSRFVAMD